MILDKLHKTQSSHPIVSTQLFKVFKSVIVMPSMLIRCACPASKAKRSKRADIHMMKKQALCTNQIARRDKPPPGRVWYANCYSQCMKLCYLAGNLIRTFTLLQFARPICASIVRFAQPFIRPVSRPPICSADCLRGLPSPTGFQCCPNTPTLGCHG